MTPQDYIDGAEEMRETLIRGLALANRIHAISQKNIGAEPDYHAVACIQAFNVGCDIRMCLVNLDALTKRLRKDAKLD